VKVLKLGRKSILTVCFKIIPVLMKANLIYNGPLTTHQQNCGNVYDVRGKRRCREKEIWCTSLLFRLLTITS